MTNNVLINIRELIIGVLLQVNQEGEYSHIALRSVLEKHQYLSKQDRAFITRVCEGTIEYMLQIDYVINQFSNVKVEKMKPVIREILRSGVYQLLYMDSVPDSAVCNEAVKLAQKKGFYSLKGFVNGVLRNIARAEQKIIYPSHDRRVEYLSVRYSMPVWLVIRWLEQYGFEQTEKMLRAFLEEKPTCIRIRQHRNSTEETIKSLQAQGVKVEKAPYVDEAYYISNYNYIPALSAFRDGRIQVQDISSMLVGKVAAPKKGDYVLDLCAAPGGKSLHIADAMEGFGTVEARDVSEAKVNLIEENFKRLDVINGSAVCMDATVYDLESVEKADILIADVPCSGLGVLGKKTDIKYKMNADKQKDLVQLQRRILENAAAYVRTRGVLIYSTCTIGQEENIDNIRWFTKNYPYKLENIDPYICKELRSETTKEGYLQLLPGTHACDGFFLARLKRVK